ncbi:Wzz/FepE/Etk N-terminal domain-containing protein [Caulobacter sp. 17J65-9]|uniref:GumC family protein n=1 Tax=Caulobacter sp. 17J65-9 TaxID=2709382 RepID=UPI0013C7C2D6|nr:Wzz/FepE/Etk N-terminal domain-containing protein [Caulobacter sp. 17J65-9]NEX91557.1 lipopolysaccharide biosynthesis protein [Caulobacter sp. 17J65-9]
MRDTDWTSGSEAPWGGRLVVRPRYSAGDLTVLLWREKTNMFLVFALVFGLGVAAAVMSPRTYTAKSSLLVQLGQEYVYEPRAGDAARGAVPKTDEVVRSEVEILSSDELKARVVKAVGLAAIDPKLAEAWNQADAEERRKIEGAAIKAIGDGLSIDTAPDTGVVRLSFKHKDAATAALILNRLVETYMSYRKEVFKDVSSPVLLAQKAAFEKRLVEADAAYETFLRDHALGDFPTEKASLSALYQNVLDERYKVDARLREVRAQLSSLSAGLASVPAEVGVQRDLDLTAPQKLLALKVDRQDLLSRYKPDSQPVKDVDAKIAELERLIGSGQGVGEKDRRLGANPVWQDLETDRVRLSAEAASLAARRDALVGQLKEVSDRQLNLTKLESEYQNLSVEREVLQTNIRGFTTRAEEIGAARAIAEGADDNIRVVERAAQPARGESMRKVIVALAFCFAAFTAVCAGLLRVFLRRGFPTAASAGRTLELPVLASAPLKTP